MKVRYEGASTHTELFIVSNVSWQPDLGISDLIDVMTLIYVVVLNALVFHWDEVCKLTNKNMGYMKQEKGRFSFSYLTDIPQSSFFFPSMFHSCQEFISGNYCFHISDHNSAPEERTSSEEKLSEIHITFILQ